MEGFYWFERLRFFRVIQKNSSEGPNCLFCASKDDISYFHAFGKVLVYILHPVPIKR